MANLFEIIIIYLSTSLWFTEGYSGIRHRRHKRLHEGEYDNLKDKPTLLDTLADDYVKKTDSYWSYHHMGIDENKNVLYYNQMNKYAERSSYDDIENSHEIVKRGINDNEKQSLEHMQEENEKTVEKRSINNDQYSIDEMKNNPGEKVVKRAIDDNEKVVKRAIDDHENSSPDHSWADLGISFIHLAKPYIPKKIRNLNLDWTQLEEAVHSFSQVTTTDVTERSLDGSPLMKTIRAMTAATTPLIMDGVRALLGKVLDFVDNAGFVTNGHAISRRGVSESVLDDLMDAFTAVLEHMVDAKHYHDDYRSL